MGNDDLNSRDIMSQLKISGLTKYFSTDRENLMALDNITININKGDFVCVLGPSGCGKTTLLRCIAGLEKPDRGEILLGDIPVKAPGPDRIVVFQDFDQLLPWKTVNENVAFPLMVKKGVSTAEISEAVRRNISMVGLSEFGNYYPHQLSGGMKQRAAIARALTTNPEVLLMDEPFASVDSQTRNALQTELISIWEKFGATIVFITHNIEEAIILGNRIVVMSKRPGTVKIVLENQLPRPRTAGSSGFGEIWNQLHGLLDTC